MCYFHAVAALTQELVELVRYKNATMLAAGAAHANHQLGLALANILGH